VPGQGGYAMKSKFYGTQEYLTDKEDRLVKHYIQQNLGKSVHYLKELHIYIDENLTTPVNLDCFYCHQVHGHTCCEGGQPYSMAGHNLQLFEEHAFAILKEFDPDGRYLFGKQKGIFESTPATNYYPCIRTFQGNCLFLVNIEGQFLCAIHRYALDHKINPYTLKPFSCSLFPLEIIQLDHHLFITALTKKTESFSRWGNYYRKNYCCVNPALRPKENAGEYFISEQAKPAWFWARELLSVYLGAETVKIIENLLPL
jgi:hypothetical protein